MKKMMMKNIYMLKSMVKKKKERKKERKEYIAMSSCLSNKGERFS
jgi:hypothetical protein